MTIKLSRDQKYLRRRILEVSHASNVSHLGSCLGAIDLIEGVYKIKKQNEKFILSNGHAGIALYVVLEKHGFIKDSKVIKGLNIHPDRNIECGIDVSTGSLGHGLAIALGMALINKRKNVYCMISDGECAEGCIWESLRIISERKVCNLKIILNANGWGAYGQISLENLQKRLKGFGLSIKKINGHNPESIESALSEKNSTPTVIFASTSVEQLPFLKGQAAHYHVMSDEDYEKGMNFLL